jgi:hypothetical protein
MCWLSQTNDYSYLRVTVIWIEVHPTVRKPDQHATRIAIFHIVINRFEQIHCHRQEGLPTQSTTQWDNEAVGKSQAPVDNRLLGLPDLYLRHAIGTFYTCLRWPTDRSLTHTSGGYNLGRADFSHHTPRPSRPTVLCFPLMAPPSLRLTINQ